MCARTFSRSLAHRLLKTFTLTILLWALASPTYVSADENRWGFGSDLGLATGTVDETVFAIGFNVDYYADRNFSFGPMMQISPTGDLFQIAFAGVGKYHLRLNNGFKLVPFTGIGLIHADLDAAQGPPKSIETTPVGTFPSASRSSIKSVTVSRCHQH